MTGAEIVEDAVSLRVRLLMDCRTAFGDSKVLPAAELLTRLRADEEAPWADLSGDGLKPRRLGLMLGEFGICAQRHRWTSAAKPAATKPPTSPTPGAATAHPNRDGTVCVPSVTKTPGRSLHQLPRPPQLRRRHLHPPHLRRHDHREELIMNAPRETRLLLRVDEAGHQLNLGRTVMYELIRSGRPRSVKVGNSASSPAPPSSSSSTSSAVQHDPPVGLAAKGPSSTTRRETGGPWAWTLGSRRWASGGGSKPATARRLRRRPCCSRCDATRPTDCRRNNAATPWARPVESWLQYGLTRRDENTRVNHRILAHKHVIPALGARRLTELTAEDVDTWLADRAKTLSTDSLNRLLSILCSLIRRAQAREPVRRNVALVCEVPRGTGGRPSKSLSLDQAQALLAAAEATPMNAYIVLLLLTGVRTEELRALTWDHLDLDAERQRSWSGDPFAAAERPRRRGLAARWNCQIGPSPRYIRTAANRQRSS